MAILFQSNIEGKPQNNPGESSGWELSPPAQELLGVYKDEIEKETLKASQPTIKVKEGFLINLLDNISLPFLSLGVWLSKGLAQLNVLMILMDFLIEAPLKSIIAIVGEWTSFIRERKEEVVEVPIQSQ